MSESNKGILCATHGEARPAYVCQHLRPGAQSEWWSARPTPENPWPSAWCADCHRAFEKEGKWNSTSEAEVGIEVLAICHHCYEKAAGRAHHRYLDDQ